MECTKCNVKKLLYFDHFSQTYQNQTIYTCLRNLNHVDATCFILSNRESIRDYKRQTSDINYYALTFTCPPEVSQEHIPELINKIMSSYLLKDIKIMVNEHITTNSHLHLLLASKDYISITKIRQMNKNYRTELVKLKGLAIKKWINYCRKNEEFKKIIIDKNI